MKDHTIGIVRRAVLAAGLFSLGSGGAWADIPASAYVRRGLIGLWDGIERGGSTETWVDLTGNHVLAAETGDGKSPVWGDDCLVFDNDNLKALTGSSPLMHAAIENKDATVEMCFEPTQGAAVPSNSGPFGFGSTGNYVIMWGNSSNYCRWPYAKGAYCDLAGNTPTGWQTSSLRMASDKAYFWGNGTELASINYGSTTSDDAFAIGRWAGNRGEAVKMNAYSFRLYARALSGEELAYNAAIDRVRFHGSNPETETWPDGYQYNAVSGKVECRVEIQATEGAKVSTDGVTFADSLTVWRAMDGHEELSITVKVAEGYQFVRWDGMPGGIAMTDTTLEVTDLAPLTIVPVVGAAPEVGTGTTFYWSGATDELASKAANWLDEDGNVATSTPLTTDSIVIDAKAENRPMTWDLDDVVPSSWTQDGYTGTVTFETGEFGLTAKGMEQTVHGVLVGGERILKLTGDLALRTGTWTVKENPEFNTSNTALEPAMTSGRGIYRLIVDVGGAAEIGADATVSVVGKGFQYTQSRWGTGKGNGAGGSHGGCGWAGYKIAIGGTGHAPQHCYGSIRAPVTIGSCGGDTKASQTLPGGALRLKVGGALTLNGKLDANAVSEFRPGQTSSRAVGSGGSVWVTAASISGTGSVTANGWTGTNYGPSGGGRISLCLTGANADFANFATNNVTAYGGFQSAGNHGSAGTIYLETAANRSSGGELWVKGDQLMELVAADYYGTEIWTGLNDDNFAFGKIVLANNVVLRVQEGVAISTKEMDGENSNYNQMRLYNGSFACSGTTPTRNVRVIVCVPDTAVGSSLLLGAGAQFLPNFATTVSGDVRLTDGGKITHWFNGSEDKNYRVNLKVTGDMSIDSVSSIDVVGRGFSDKSGDGKPGIGSCASGHGGRAGNPAALGVCYGSFKEPTTLGSGSSHIAGSGAVNLDVAGTLTVNGTITTRGQDQVAYPSAGGSIWIRAGRMIGSGVLCADAGNSNGNQPYSAGGGRIAVTVRETGAKVSDFAGPITAYGGGAANHTKDPIGGAGTLYFRDADQDADSGRLVIDNGGCKTENLKTVITTAMSDETVGAVVITNKAQLIIENNRTLTVKGDWNATGCSPATIGATASGTDKAGKVVFAGSGTSVISGTNYFGDVACTTPGKVLGFGTEGTQIRVDGELTIAGEKDNLVTLASLVPGEQWLLDVVGSSSVSFAKVSDSDALVGKPITAIDSTDGKNNINWTFISAVRPGAEITWKSTAVSSDWSDAYNWVDENGDNRIPIETDHVTIPSGSANCPVLAGATTVAGLTIPAGATFDSGGFDLTVTKALTCAGALNFGGAEKLSLLGDADLSGATMSSSPAEVALCGDALQTVDFGGLSFTKVTLANTTAGTAAKLLGGFAAKWLYCEQSDAVRTYQFEPGKTVTVTGELRLMGANGEDAMLSLVSVTEGMNWGIASKGVATVSGVAVRYSNAGSGNRIYACRPSSGHGCDAGWVFNVPTSTWTGAGGDNLFANGDNWAEGVAPTRDSIVYVNTAATISVGDEADAQALTLVVEDGGTATFTGSTKLVLDDSLQVMGGGTLTADVPIEVGNDVAIFGGAKVSCSENGYWDGVTDPAALSYKRIVLTVGGNMIVESGAEIDVTGKGFKSGVNEQAIIKHGPGFGRGGGYAGWGFRLTPPAASYGSVFSPMSLGSSGNDDIAGGAVRLTIGGTLTLDGAIKSNGRDASETGIPSYKGSGGSVWVTCAALVGSGTIEARGGHCSNDYTGSGGRISVVQTVATDFSDWSGSITAFGGLKQSDTEVPRAPCGTIFTKSAGEGGTILFDNDDGSHGDAKKDSLGMGYGYTDIVSTNYTTDVKRDFADVTLRLQRGTTVNLLYDLKVKDVEMLTANTELRLNGNTLKVAVRKHELLGTVIADGGRIDWWVPGLLIFVR